MRCHNPGITLPGDSVQQENGPLALDGDVSADLNKSFIFVVFGIELLLENCITKRNKELPRLF